MWRNADSIKYPVKAEIAPTNEAEKDSILNVQKVTFPMAF